MRRNVSLAAMALCAAVFAAPACRAECAQHTFDPCPGPTPAYDIEVDRKTGRTWLKDAHAETNDTSTLARLAATAKNVPPGSMAKAAEDERSGGWSTRVEAGNKSPPPLQ